MLQIAKKGGSLIATSWNSQEPGPGTTERGQKTEAVSAKKQYSTVQYSI